MKENRAPPPQRHPGVSGVPLCRDHHFGTSTNLLSRTVVRAAEECNSPFGDPNSDPIDAPIVGIRRAIRNNCGVTAGCRVTALPAAIQDRGVPDVSNCSTAMAVRGFAVAGAS